MNLLLIYLPIKNRIVNDYYRFYLQNQYYHMKLLKQTLQEFISDLASISIGYIFGQNSHLLYSYNSYYYYYYCFMNYQDGFQVKKLIIFIQAKLFQEILFFIQMLMQSKMKMLTKAAYFLKTKISSKIGSKIKHYSKVFLYRQEIFSFLRSTYFLYGNLNLILCEGYHNLVFNNYYISHHFNFYLYYYRKFQNQWRFFFILYQAFDQILIILQFNLLAFVQNCLALFMILNLNGQQIIDDHHCWLKNQMCLIQNLIQKIQFFYQL
ncbi:transmembrane protein, putative (macronuclear) [Tetrahymena thermophila SB210]|uniref:Transmembrane protein, putative n=1 Tax=Tetrahymena thermophila (strain SB210) TaxID=312017 RepID=W7XFF5_TETTS|nr:transmembrane protein, putative [Tetrahymena thermophila SB210]EWS72741.1 transmembrane protein, putative [Tetrahymena thermophila SB210]|eukprot:XP_012654719.1 transmembrane protein, putative [Tetrahymena thermophila SB210]